MTAEGTFALTRDFGIPARAEGPLMLEEGGSFRLTMEGSQLETAEIQELNFHLQNPVADGQGRVEGSVAGTYHFPESALTANASATIAEEWIFNPTWGEFALCEGGTVNASIEPGLSPAVDLNVDFRADIASEIPVKLIGNIKLGWLQKKSEIHLEQLQLENQNRNLGRVKLLGKPIIRKIYL